MNLVASLSVDGEMPIGAMEWYDMLAPIIALQMPDFQINKEVLCKDLLAAILQLPGDTRAKILMVKVPSKHEQNVAVQEAKQQSHRGMLVGIGAVITVIAVIILGVYVTLTSMNGGDVDKEAISTVGKVVSELVKLFLGTE